MGIVYHVVEGDPLDSGNNSEVIEGLRDCTIEGPDGRYRNQAFIGHRAYCGACESAGPIAGGPGTPGYNLRMYDATIRAREAVEGDIVVCKCSPPPRIIAVYGRSSSIHDVDRSANSTASATDAMRVLGAAASGALAAAADKVLRRTNPAAYRQWNACRQYEIQDRLCFGCDHNRHDRRTRENLPGVYRCGGTSANLLGELTWLTHTLEQQRRTQHRGRWRK